jgi:UDP-N-acetylglucosamine:LPS N-acetylglucosamine transferase
LRPFWGERDRFWVTFDTPDAKSLLEGERRYWAHHPTNRHVPNLIRNSFQAIRILLRERPSLIVSSGAAPAIPYFWLARVFGARAVFIEVLDRLDSPTITGRVVSPIAHAILVQWAEQQRFYPRATLVGPIL